VIAEREDSPELGLAFQQFEAGIALRLDEDGRHFRREAFVDPNAADLHAIAAPTLAARRARQP